MLSDRQYRTHKREAANSTISVRPSVTRTKSGKRFTVKFADKADPEMTLHVGMSYEEFGAYIAILTAKYHEATAARLAAHDEAEKARREAAKAKRTFRRPVAS